MVATSAPGRPSVWSELFTASGRTNRGRYWLITLLTVLVQVVVAFGLVFSLGNEPLDGRDPLYVLSWLWLVVLIVSIPAILASIRRLHDRDKSGHWLWLFVVVPAVLGNGGYLLALEPTIMLVLSLIGFAISVWAFVELGCLRGTVGPNRFGPDPLQGQA